MRCGSDSHVKRLAALMLCALLLTAPLDCDRGDASGYFS